MQTWTLGLLAAAVGAVALECEIAGLAFLGACVLLVIV